MKVLGVRHLYAEGLHLGTICFANLLIGRVGRIHDITKTELDQSRAQDYEQAQAVAKGCGRLEEHSLSGHGLACRGFWIPTCGSHHIFDHEDLPEIVNLQNAKGKAKPYQVGQFLELIENYNLEFGEEE